MNAESNLDWVTMLAELVAFQERHGHISVDEHRKRYPVLAAWLSEVGRRLHTLAYDQILDLDRQGFFGKLDRKWLDRYAQLRSFKDAIGHCDVPVRWPRNQSLAGWVQTQRHDASKMDSWRRKLLTDLGFSFRLRHKGIGSSVDWEEVLKRLTRYKQRFGDCNVPARWSEDRTLGAWVYRLRSIKECLPPKVIARFDALGFVWESPFDAAWEKGFRELEAFKKKIGHCDVPARLPENLFLAGWVQAQRRKASKMAPLRRKRLTDLGFNFRVRNRGIGSRGWEDVITRLTRYKQRFGDCNVPKEWREDKNLGYSVSRLRRIKKWLPLEVIKRLEAMEFDWKPIHPAWEQRFRELEAFKARHGHCRVPNNKSDPLGIWVGKLRSDKKTLSAAKILRLDQIGFDWRPFETAWRANYERLLAFRRRFGHANVPARWAENRELSTWVGEQRGKKAQLSAAQVALLEKAGLDWDPYETIWMRHYEELKAFHRKNGHWKVHTFNPLLAKWVGHQRTKANKMAPHRKKLLDDIGFEWSVLRQSKFQT